MQHACVLFFHIFRVQDPNLSFKSKDPHVKDLTRRNLNNCLECPHIISIRLNVFAKLINNGIHDIVITDQLDFLPLTNYDQIVEANALRIDWNDVVDKNKLDYIIGNPPFVGYSNQTAEQKNEVREIYVDEKGKPYNTAGKIDYVACWYFKACQLMQETPISAAWY